MNKCCSPPQYCDYGFTAPTESKQHLKRPLKTRPSRSFSNRQFRSSNILNFKMVNATLPALDLLHGYINSTHTTDLTPYYPSGNLPTPYPLVILSVLISMVISCYSCKGAFTSISSLRQSVSRVHNHPKSPWARKKNENETAIHETELENLHKKGVPMHKERKNSFDPPPPYMSEAGSVFEEPVPEPVHPPEMTSAIAEEDIGAPEVIEETRKGEWWEESRSRKIVGTIFVVYSTFRAVTALVVNVQALIDHHTSASAPSVLLLLLVSIQMLTANYSIPRLIRGILTIDILLVATAFLIAAFASLANNQNYPAYAQLALAGGTCPFYTSNCHSQATHWDVVGCGNYISLANPDDQGQDYPAPTGFFDPYTSDQGNDLNTKMNSIHIVEAIVTVFGLIWLLTAIFQIYEGRYLVWPRKERRRGRYLNGAGDQPCGVTLMGMTALLGIIGAFVATFMLAFSLSLSLSLSRI